MTDVLDTNLRDFSGTYHSWVDNPEEWDNAIIQWHIEAKGRPPHIHEMRHAYWRVIKEGERWGTLRNALQDTWPLDDSSNGPVPHPAPVPVPAPPPPSSLPQPPARPSPGPVLNRVVRVTNEQDGDFMPRMYSYWPNAVIRDGAIYVFAIHVDGSPRFFRVSQDGTVARLGPLLPYRTLGEGWYFDADAGVYLIDGPRLRRVNPFSLEDRIVFSIERTHPGCELWQAHSSDDGNVHSATVQRVVSEGAYPRIGTVVCRWRDQTFFAAVGDLDESQITPDGEFLIIKETLEDGLANRIITLASGNERLLRKADGAVGHSDCGPGSLVGEWSPPPGPEHGQCVYWDLRTLTRRELFATWNMGHVSVRGDVCLSSNSDTIAVVDLNGGGRRPFLNHGMVIHDPEHAYDDMTKANLDPSGRIACYMSNQGGSRFDVFVAPVPR